MNRLLILCLGFTIFLGCAHVPMQSVELSEELSGMIAAAEASHMALIEQYIDGRRRQAEDFLQTKGIPGMMEKMVTGSTVLDDFESAATPLAKAEVMTEFSADAAVEIADWRDSMMRTLDEVESLLKSEVHAHYMDMLTVNAALTAHLRSSAKVTETREQLLGALRIDPDKLIPLDRINGVLDRVITAEGKIEDVADRVKEVRDILSNPNPEETE